ncbi:suppressor of cytokine signaling 7 isoform X2 [Conger conger]|uniref:suppressor of cytokine signaling 7 isoform X2 n=1 Tax=Conger conger TaxID=82655 RepID=UPI002A5AFD94|nr:suppressor of cytokine signaling 7 isoform X2 [Conger conger]
MNNAKDMSPDFVLMRLVSGAEDDRLDEENGNLSSSGGVMAGFGKAVLGHRGNNIKNGFELDLNNTTGPVRPSPSSLYSSQRDSGTLAPDSGVMVTRPPMPDPPPPVAQSFQHRAGRGARPQLMVFRNLLGDGDGILECGPEQPAVVQSNETDGQDSSPASVTTSGINNSINCGVDVQQQNHLSQRPPWNFHPRVKSDVIADGSEVDGGGDGGLCPRHRVTDPNDWPPLLSFGILNPRWACTAGEINSHIDDPVFDLARKFGDLGVDQASKILFKDGELPQCPCQTILASAAAGIAHGDDPAETSDALLVLEGLGTEEVDGLGINNCSAEELNDASCPAFALNGKEDMVQKMTEAFSSRTLTGLVKQAQRLASDGCSPAYRDPQVCCSRTEMLGPRPQLQPGANHTELLSGLSTPVGASPCGSAQDLQTTAQSRTATPKLLADRASMSLSSRSIQEEGEKATRVSRKSRKGSFKIRLGKLFRTKNTSVSMNVLDKRPSLASSTSSTGSLMDVWSSTAGDQDAGSSSQPSRTHSAFSPGPFSPVFTGETVSLVDVDISRRGVNSPHPPTPPPPPRRSLSLLDTFLRALPRPNPSQADAPPPSQSGPPPLLCPLTCPDASSFATSLRELEKCGWYWGPMNWEDAEMKLKGKPDGSFLVRDSSDPRYILSLSFRSQNITHHTRMEHYRGTFSLWCHPRFEDRCHSVVEFIERAIMHSKNGKFLYFLRSRVPGLPPTPVQLLYPVSRFSNIKSLQHLCRFRIRQLVRIDHIQELPLPKSLIDYLRKFYYYDPEEEMYLSIKEARRGMGVEPVVESQT